MEVRMLWGLRKMSYPGEYAPELMVAWDEHCLDDNWDGYESTKAAEIKAWGSDITDAREIVVSISDDALDALFATPAVDAQVVATPTPERSTS